MRDINGDSAQSSKVVGTGTFCTWVSAEANPPAKSKLGCTAAPHPETVPTSRKLRAIELGIAGLCGYRIGFHGTMISDCCWLTAGIECTRV